MQTRDCMKCGRGYYDDGNTWCPKCDAGQSFGPNAHPDASLRVLAMREKYQSNLAAGRPYNDDGNKNSLDFVPGIP